MAKYRHRFDILANIIRVAGKGAGKTRILYFANLNYLLLEKYLKETLRAGFLRLGEEGYSVTEKGQDFLDNYAQYLSESNRIESDIEGLKQMQKKLEGMCSRKFCQGSSKRSQNNGKGRGSVTYS